MVIWHEVLPPDRCLQPSIDETRFITASSHILDEFSETVWGNVTLTLRLQSSSILPIFEIMFHDQQGNDFWYHPCFMGSMNMEKFKGVQSSYLRGVNIENEAPNPDDPAELISLWPLVIWLLDLLHN